MNFINLFSIQSVVKIFLFFSVLRVRAILMLPCIFLYMVNVSFVYTLYIVQSVHIFATQCFNFA